MSTLATHAEKMAALEAAWITYPELSRLTGFSTKHLGRLVAEGKLPGVLKQGRAVRFHKATVLKWFAQQAGIPADLDTPTV